MFQEMKCFNSKNDEDNKSALPRCSSEDAGFTTSADVKDNEALCHEEKEPSNSEPYNHGTTSSPNLATDTSIHNEEQSYFRHVSDIKSNVKSGSREHKATRARPRMLACAHCDYTSSSKSNLPSHIFRRHMPSESKSNMS